MLKKIKKWICEGNDCSRCTACWDEVSDTENGREYDCGCYIKGSAFDEKPCRIPFLIRLILCRRGKYLNNHLEFMENEDAGQDIIRAELEKQINGVICWKGSDGTFHEYDQDYHLKEITWRVKSEYDDFIRKQNPIKPIRKKWAELIKETICIPVEFVKSFIFK